MDLEGVRNSKRVGVLVVILILRTLVDWIVWMNFCSLQSVAEIARGAIMGTI